MSGDVKSTPGQWIAARAHGRMCTRLRKLLRVTCAWADTTIPKARKVRAASPVRGATCRPLSVTVPCSPSLGKSGFRARVIGVVAEGLPAFNDHWGSFADVTSELESVPVGKADAAVRSALADLARIGCAVDAVALRRQRDPD